MKKEKIVTYTVEYRDGTPAEHIRLLPADRSDRLHEMYRLLACELVDVITFESEGVAYDIWFDEEFLLKNRPVPTLIIGEPKKNAFTLICGNVLIAKCNEDGEMEGLNTADIARVKRWINTAVDNLITALVRGIV